MSPDSRAAAPPFFEVTGGLGANLQLLGTIHLGPAGGWTFPAQVDQALDLATTFVMEIDLRSVTEEMTSQAMMRHGILPAETPLSKIISPETAKLLATNEDLLTASGLPGSVREAMQPWLIMAVLVETLAAESGYSTTQSVEETLTRQLGGRPLLALESLDEQMAFFGQLPFGLQELVLQDVLLRARSIQPEIEELIALWRTHDSSGLARISREGTEQFPDLDAFYEVILDERNRNWIPKLIELLEDPERAGTSIVVAVGAMHLVGPTGVPSLLREAGYRVSTPYPPVSRDPGSP